MRLASYCWRACPGGACPEADDYLLALEPGLDHSELRISFEMVSQKPRVRITHGKRLADSAVDLDEESLKESFDGVLGGWSEFLKASDPATLIDLGATLFEAVFREDNRSQPEAGASRWYVSGYEAKSVEHQGKGTFSKPW